MSNEFVFTLRGNVSIDVAVEKVKNYTSDRVNIIDMQKDMFLAEMDAATLGLYFLNGRGDAAIPQSLTDYIRFVERNLEYNGGPIKPL